MTPKRELQIAYSLIIVFLFVGAISFAAFPAKTPDEPVRLMYKTVAGKVLFDQQNPFMRIQGTASPVPGLSPSIILKNPKKVEDSACSVRRVSSKFLKKVKTFPDSCLDCHEAEDLEDSGMSQKNPMHSIHSVKVAIRKLKSVRKKRRCSWCHVM